MTAQPPPRPPWLWVFVHNALIHPLLAFPFQPGWALRAHDRTAAKIPGYG